MLPLTHDDRRDIVSTTTRTIEDSDEALVRGVAAGDETALRKIMDIYGGAALAMARHVLADPVMAEEAAQDAFVALWMDPTRFDVARGSLKSFLIGIARNKAIDMVRREERRRAAVQRSVVDGLETDDDSIDRLEDRAGLMDALKKLSQLQRQAIALAYLGGFSYREVARRLDIPEGTAKTRLRDGLTALRANLAQVA